MKIHFIAIGGSIMHDLAICLKNIGHQVSGSDDIIYEPSKSKLEKVDILPKEWGWFPDKISPDLDMVILGMHAHKDNPELLKAQKLGLKIHSFPEFLYEYGKNKTRVVIAGSHGKSTVTAMILHVMNKVGKEVDYIVGAKFKGTKGNVHLTEENDIMILEGDEYLSSRLDPRPKFIHYKANMMLINGIAWDHINVFETEEKYFESFEQLLESATEGSALIYPQYDKNLANLVENNTKYFKKITFDILPYSIDSNGDTSIDSSIGKVPIKVFGKHNISNMSGARWICNQLGVMDEEFFESIADFEGADKRMEIVLDTQDIKCFIDFAHAPSKVKATTDAIRERFPNHTIIGCLEIHTYSSLSKEFLPNYRDSLAPLDKSLIYFDPKNIEIKRLKSIDNDEIIKAFGKGDIQIANNREQVETFITENTKKPCILLLMSSGSFAQLDMEKLKSQLSK